MHALRGFGVMSVAIAGLLVVGSSRSAEEGQKTGSDPRQWHQVGGTESEFLQLLQTAVHPFHFVQLRHLPIRSTFESITKR